jgi:hypothetical protein
MIPRNSKPRKKEVEILSEKRQEKDAFDIYQEGVTNVIDELAKLQPAYIQSVTNLQHEYTETFKKAIESTISVQKEFVNAIWGPGRFPSALVRNTNEIADAYVKAATITNKAVIASVDAATQNIRTFSSSIDTFARINQNLVKTWQTFTPSRM